MPFVKGQPRPENSGRKSQADIRQVYETCTRLGCDPFEIIAKIGMDPKTTKALRVRCAAELAQYLAPKLKSIEHSGSVEVSMKRLIGVPLDEV